MTLDLESEKNRLERKISELELKITPIQKEIRQLRERLSHVSALLPANSSNITNTTTEKLPKGFWKNLCNKHNLYVGGDSAHRVVFRKAPQLHNSIHHKCDIDGKMYPQIEGT